MNGEPRIIKYGIKMGGKILYGGQVWDTHDEARAIASSIYGDWRIVPMEPCFVRCGWKEVKHG